MTRLRTHEKIHSNETFQCKICDKRFKNKYDMQRHEEAHIESEEKQFKCKKCSKKFNKITLVRDHQRIHKEHLKSFEFKTYGKCFRQTIY